MKEAKKLVVWTNFAILSAVAVLWYLITSYQYSAALGKYATDPDFEEKKAELWSCVLYNARGRVLPPIKFNYEYDRLVVSAFLHKGPRHLAGNVVFHWFLLTCVTDFYSVWELLFSTYYSILAGNIFSSVYMPNEISVGSSGFVFSLLGLMIVQTLVSLVLSKERRMFIGLKLALAIVFLVFGFSPQNDRYNHAHGLVVGLLVGFLKIAGYRRDYLEEVSHRRKWKFIVVGSKLLMGIIPLAHLAWIVLYYGEPKDHAAAILNMGCDIGL